jgi:hypothetical protein
MNWFIITSPFGKRRVEELLQELNISKPINPLIYVRLGYKVLSTQEKETYYLLKDLSDINYKKHKDPICNPSLDYLAIALGTNESTQIYRLKKLEKYKLIKLLPNKAYYIYTPPFPDSTFINTIIKLLRRKELNKLVSLYKRCNNPKMRLDYMSRIKKIINTGTTNYEIDHTLLDE